VVAEIFIFIFKKMQQKFYASLWWIEPSS